jgi:hypothetical protein
MVGWASPSGVMLSVPGGLDKAGNGAARRKAFGGPRAC